MTRFRTKPELHARNQEKGRNIRVVPADIARPDGGANPGVVIFSGQYFIAALEAGHAYKLASGIADALEQLRNQETQP